MELNPMLINRDYSKLPKKYWARQNLCWYLHDVILSMFKEVIDKELINTKVNFENKEDIDSFEECEDIYAWLKQRKRDDEFTLMICKNLALSLLGDFLNYVYEVLSSLERGKITIACDLLRKPFKDNLLYMEWILFDSKNLSNLVYNEDIDKYAQGRGGLSKKCIKEMVLWNVSKNRFISGFNSREIEESVYDIRYNYDSSNSLELLWNQATHLVTTNKKIRTKEFNFIFNNIDDFDSYWKCLYDKIPFLLLYTIGIVESIFDKYFRKIEDITKTYNFQLIMGKFFASKENTKQAGETLINLMNGNLNLICDNCNKIVKIKKPESYVFYNYWDVLCPICKKEINICKYFFLENYR